MTESDGPTPLPSPPPSARLIFGDRLEQAVAYVGLLADTGITHGLIGPREGPRLWDRHVLNCAVVGELIPAGAQVADLGSGAGLPGLALAIARPDLSVWLIEPLARRAGWLRRAVAELGLSRVQVVEGRAESLAGSLVASVLTARAVASIDRLAAWGLPLLGPDGVLLALKGSSAGDELRRHRPGLARLGVRDATVELCGVGMVEPPTTVIRLTGPLHGAPVRARRGQGRGRGRFGTPSAGGQAPEAQTEVP